MISYICNRLVQAMIALLLMSVVVFFLSRMGGDPLTKMLPDDATPEARAQLAIRLGLNKPLHEQYFFWIQSIAVGDFGNSILQHHPVLELLKTFAPNTLKLALLAMLFGLLTGIPLGILAAVRRGHWEDVIAGIVAVLSQSAPMFWLGLVLLYLFAIKWHVFPILSSEGFLSAILPSVSLGLFMTAGIMRLTRSAMINAMDADYITLARVKGLPERIVIFKHALKNALIPVVTLTGTYFALLMSGAVVIEVVFSWPGIGLLTFKSGLGGDYPVIQGTVIVTTMAVLIINFLVDIAYALIDPRIRYGESD